MERLRNRRTYRGSPRSARIIHLPYRVDGAEELVFQLFELGVSHPFYHSRYMTFAKQLRFPAWKGHFSKSLVERNRNKLFSEGRCMIYPHNADDEYSTSYSLRYGMEFLMEKRYAEYKRSGITPIMVFDKRRNFYNDLKHNLESLQRHRLRVVVVPAPVKLMSKPVRKVHPPPPTMRRHFWLDPKM